MAIEEYIGFGKDNAVTRDELKALTAMSDRKVRREIEKARTNGVIILNLSDGKGYYRPTIAEYEDAMHEYRQERKRAMKILVNNRELYKWLEDVKHGRLKEV